MFGLSLYCSCTAWGLSLFPTQFPPVSRLGVGKTLGGDTAGTVDSNWPKGYSMAYNVMISNKTDKGRSQVGWWVGFQGGQRSENSWPSVCLWEMVGDFLCFAWFSYLLHWLNCLYLGPWVFLPFFLVFSPHSSGWGSEQVAMWVLGYWARSILHHP